MKVSSVSFASKISSPKPLPKKSLANFDNRFLYSSAEKNSNNVNMNIKHISAAFLCAMAITGLSVINIKKKSKGFVSNAAVELLNPQKGLNKIKKFAGNIKQLKDEILYPYLATMKGDKYFVQNNKLKTGMILAGENSNDLYETMAAFREHAGELGIKTVPFPHKKLKNQEEAHEWVYEQFSQAQENFKKTGEYTFIDIGKVDYLFKSKGKKVTTEGAEKMLNFFKEDKTEGVFWSAVSENTKQWPFFYENPVLITKLM